MDDHIPSLVFENGTALDGTALFRRRPGLTFLYGRIVADIGADIDLPRPTDAPLGVIHTLFPLGDPPRQTADGKHDSEHVGRNSDGSQNHAAVKIHVGIEIVVDEIIILKGHRLQLFGDLQQRVLNLQCPQKPVAHLLHNDGAGIKGFIDPMAEPHESERIVPMICNLRRLCLLHFQHHLNAFHR